MFTKTFDLGFPYAYNITIIHKFPGMLDGEGHNLELINDSWATQVYGASSKWLNQGRNKENKY